MGSSLTTCRVLEGGERKSWRACFNSVLPMHLQYLLDVIGMKEDELQVDVSGLSQGMYFVRVGERKYQFLRD